MFVSFGASAKGFRFCGSILGLDSTYWKYKYQEILLAAMAVDVLGSLFPIAHAVVITEDDDNWFYFYNNYTQFEVLSTIAGGEYHVNIDTKTCSCKSWQGIGIPYSYALFSILSFWNDPQEYAEKFYTLKFYRNTYINTIFHPLT